jgi:hypothetical protein
MGHRTSSDSAIVGREREDEPWVVGSNMDSWD